MSPLALLAQNLTLADYVDLLEMCEKVLDKFSRLYRYSAQQMYMSVFFNLVGDGKGPGGGGGGLSQNLGWVCGPLPRTFTLFTTKVKGIPYPIYDLTLKSIPFSDMCYS